MSNEGTTETTSCFRPPFLNFGVKNASNGWRGDR